LFERVSKFVEKKKKKGEEKEEEGEREEEENEEEEKEEENRAKGKEMGLEGDQDEFGYQTVRATCNCCLFIRSSRHVILLSAQSKRPQYRCTLSLSLSLSLYVEGYTVSHMFFRDESSPPQSTQRIDRYHIESSPERFRWSHRR